MVASPTRMALRPAAFGRAYGSELCSGFRAYWTAWVALVFVLSIALQAGAQEPGPASVVTPPEAEQRVDAIYPPAALAARREGTVVLFVTVEVDGSVGPATVAESAGEGFDKAALVAVKQWKFSPARRGDEPISSRIRVPFAFVLRTPATEPDKPAAAATEPIPPTV